MPRVSIILPTFNDLDYLKIAIQTALNQIYQNFELIVVDDGSDDGTKEYLATLKNPRLIVYHKENGGCFDALNYGIERARGELITWISSDNWCPDYFLDALVAGIDSHTGAKFAYASYYNIDAEGNIFSVNVANHQFPNEMLTSSHRGNAAFIYYKDCHNIVGPYISSHSCDTDMWIKLTSMLDGRSVYIIEPVYFYRFHDKRVTNGLPRNYISQTLVKLFENFQQLHGSQNILKRIYPKTIESGDPHDIAMACNDIALRYADKGLINHAVTFWRTGFKIADKPALRALIHNLAETFAKYNLEGSDMTQEIMIALEENSSIDRKTIYIEKAMKTFLEAKEEGCCGYIKSDQILIHEYTASFVCFSYCAWKSGMTQTSVPQLISVRP